jgi:DNA topoisomerase-2
LGGLDAASPRYIFTKLSKITRILFDVHDDPLLTPRDDDGQLIEPHFYVPIIPLVLVNGSSGVGTGFSTFIPSYHPLDIIENVRAKLEGRELTPMHPFIRGFCGTVHEIKEHTFQTEGSFEIVGKARKKIQITELPAYKWTQTYKDALVNIPVTSFKNDKTFKGRKGQKSLLVKSFTEHHTTNKIFFNVSLNSDIKIADEEQTRQKLVKALKLTSTFNTGNMHLFNRDGEIKKYNDPLDILEEFFVVRMEYYELRYENMLVTLRHEANVMKNKERFVQMVIDGELVLSGKKRSMLVEEMTALKFDEHTSDTAAPTTSKQPETAAAADYKYLLGQPLSALTEERVAQLKARAAKKTAEMRALEALTPANLWLNDLEVLEAEIVSEYEDEDGVAQPTTTL